MARLDPGLILAASRLRQPVTWDADQVVLYHLGLGLGSDPDRHVRYVDESQLEPLPTFASMLATEVSGSLLRGIEGLEVDRLVQVGQELRLYDAVPPSGRATSTAHVEDVQDRGDVAIITVAVETTLASGRRLAVNRLALRAAGLGGTDRDASRPTRSERMPSTAPSDQFELATLTQQAAIFRLTADRTPLHVDPEFARRVGFARPPLQGLCTWGMVASALAQRSVADRRRLATHTARFAGVVYPGDTLRVDAWWDGGRCRWQAHDAATGRRVLTHGETTFV